LLNEARALLRQGRWAKAASSYRRLRQLHPKSSEARTVAVALGQLELDRLGQPQAAKNSFQNYLDAGGGALSQEARYGKLRALRALGERSAEREAIHQYLALYPASANAPALERRKSALGGR
jgi:outer membrane protein assembly factor BamD (BamD/ComL family)